MDSNAISGADTAAADSDFRNGGTQPMRRIRIMSSGMAPSQNIIVPGGPIDFTVGIMPINFVGYLDSAANRARVILSGAKAIRLQFANSLNIDADIQWAGQNGIKVMLFFYSSGCNPETTAGRQCYADRAAAFASTYPNTIKWIEVWNEWNGGLGLGGPAGCAGVQGSICTDLVTYTDLLRRTYLAVKAVSPTTLVVGGGVAGTDLPWTSDLYDEGGGNFMDAISIHPYVYLSNQTRPFTVAYTASAPVAVAEFSEAVTAMHDQGTAKTGRDIPIYITEEGRNSAATAPSEQLTSDYLSLLYPTVRANLPFVHGIFWFCSRDFDGQAFGLDRTDNSPRPAFAAYQAVAGV